MSPLRRSLLAAPLFVGLLLAPLACSKDSGSPTTPPVTGGKELNSANLAQNGSYSHTFPNAGTFPYHCTIHTSMTAGVTVVGGGADSALVNITGLTFSPPSTSVKPGGTVRWVNLDGVPHTVTSD
jgi:plastocyanin